MKKKILFSMAALAAMMCIVFTACNGDNEPTGGGDGVTFSGKLLIVEEEYDDATGKYKYTSVGYATNEIVDNIAVYVQNYESREFLSIGTYSVNNGNFSFALPTPPDECLSLFTARVASGINLSDETVKTVSVSFSSLIPLKDGKGVGNLSLLPADLSNDDDLILEVIYCDKAVNLTGGFSDEGTYNIDGKDITYKDVREYDVKFKKGWNVLIGVETETVSGNTITTTTRFTATNQIPANVMWTLELNNSSNVQKSAIQTKSLFK